MIVYMPGYNSLITALCNDSYGLLFTTVAPLREVSAMGSIRWEWQRVVDVVGGL